MAGALVVGAIVAEGSSPDVEVQLFRYRPDRLAIWSGDRVRWTNRDDITHTITAGTPEAPQSTFRLVLAGRGATASAEFLKQGSSPYFCERHRHMQGEITVQEQERRTR